MQDAELVGVVSLQLAFLLEERDDLARASTVLLRGAHLVQKARDLIADRGSEINASNLDGVTALPSIFLKSRIKFGHKLHLPFS